MCDLNNVLVRCAHSSTDWTPGDTLAQRAITQCVRMAVRGTSEIVLRIPGGTFWVHSGRFLGEGGVMG